VRPRPTAGEVHVFTADLEEAVADESVLSEDECERAERFRFERDRHRYVVARSVLRRLLGSYLDVDPSDVELLYGDHGRPYVREPTLSFNLAHSGRSAVFAFAGGFEVGVDVELLAHGGSENERVAERFFSSLEVATLLAHAQAVRSHAFLRCWTRKEAFVKARGDGLSLPLQDFDVTFAPGVRPAILRTAWSEHEPGEWTLHDISGFLPGTVAALATRAESRAVLKGHND
jgi:4'-phosphopantetheinyl transferase